MNFVVILQTDIHMIFSDFDNSKTQIWYIMTEQQLNKKEYRYILIALILILGFILFRELQPYLSGFMGAITLFVLLRGQMKYLTKKKKQSGKSPHVYYNKRKANGKSNYLSGKFYSEKNKRFVTYRSSYELRFFSSIRKEIWCYFLRSRKYWNTL